MVSGEEFTMRNFIICIFHLIKPNGRWEANIRVNLKEIGVSTRNWINLAQNRDYWRDFVDSALNFRIP